jgi:23S rRNA (guanosine2251-2'-O)-methyltransferase
LTEAPLSAASPSKRRAPGRSSRKAASRPPPRGPIDPETVWLFGLHAVRDALSNPARVKRRLILTPNSAERLRDVLPGAGIAPEIAEPRRFSAPLDPGSVHQGAALEAAPLDWGALEDRCAPTAAESSPVVLLLDRVTDPHNVGAALRTAAVFGAAAVIAPRRHAAPETGALAKAASGALERQPYLRVANLVRAMETLKTLGYAILGLDGDAAARLDDAVTEVAGKPLALALGAEGPGLREGTRAACDRIVRIPADGAFRSLNVSNAAAIALYAAQTGRGAR